MAQPGSEVWEGFQLPLVDLPELAERVMCLLRPKEESAADPAASATVRSIVQMLQGATRTAERRAEVAEEGLSIAEAKLQRLQTALDAMTRYAESLEEERDQARGQLAEEQKMRSEDEALLAEVEKLLSRRQPRVMDVEAQPMRQSKQSAQPAPQQELAARSPTDMCAQELREECALRGLVSEGSLAVLRARVRVARAQERSSAQN